MKTILLTLVVGFVIFASSNALALSYYGRSCANNDDCVDCKEEEECLSCMNKCYNFYGDPETRDNEKLTEAQHCRKKQSKWCYAQCWDPDDIEDPDYVSTKPKCATLF